MKPKEVYFVVDTNALIQCRWLDEVEWSDVTDSDKVRLIVCRPVQREIDKLKRSPGRRGERARKVHAKIRKLLLKGNAELVVRDKSPQVHLSLFLQELSGSGGSSQPDDQIVTCLGDYRQQFPEHQARLLTHDSGPMASAKHLGLPFTPIPDTWLLPPEPGWQQKEISRLKSKILELEAREPQFEVAALNSNGQEVDVLTIEIPEYRPFTEQEIDQLVDSVARHFPVQENFPPPNPEQAGETRKCEGQFDFVYLPPDKARIQKYQKEEYPAWLDSCRTVFGDLHKECQQLPDPPWIFIEARNTGTRPAINALVSMEAKGDFWLFTPERRKAPNEERETEKKLEGMHLPEPPKPPEWTWRLQLKSDLDSYCDDSQPETDLAKIGITEALRANVASIADTTATLRTEPLIHPASLPTSFQRDPEEFYWRSGTRGIPLKFQSFECQRWRHASATEEFSAQIWLSDDAGEISGSLNFRIEAENLSRPVEHLIPVRITRVKIPPLSTAEELIEDLRSSSAEAG